jgi:hypothetical protein
VPGKSRFAVNPYAARVPKVGLEPTRPCGDRILSVGQQLSVTLFETLIYGVNLVDSIGLRSAVMLQHGAFVLYEWCNMEALMRHFLVRKNFASTETRAVRHVCIETKLEKE